MAFRSFGDAALFDGETPPIYPRVEMQFYAPMDAQKFLEAAHDPAKGQWTALRPRLEFFLVSMESQFDAQHQVVPSDAAHMIAALCKGPHPEQRRLYGLFSYGEPMAVEDARACLYETVPELAGDVDLTRHMPSTSLYFKTASGDIDMVHTQTTALYDLNRTLVWPAAAAKP